MKNICTAFIIGCLEIGILYVVLYFAKVAGVDLRVLSISSVITQMIAVLLLPIICLLVFRKDTGSLFRIRHTYLLLLLCIMYCVFFCCTSAISHDWLLSVYTGFNHHRVFRGVFVSGCDVFHNEKREYSFGNCIEQFILGNHTCRISNGSGWW